MENYKTVEFDLTQETEENLVALFGAEFPKPESTITIEELMALPEPEYRNMQIAVMTLKALKEHVEMCSGQNREEKEILTEESLLESLGDGNYDNKEDDDEEAYW